MINFEEMKYIVAFAKYGTLSKVADQCHISQPTLTRAMKKAEVEFGVPLFNRTRNSISFNDNGLYVARELSRILNQVDEMVADVKSYDKTNRTISIGSAAAVQLPSLVQMLSNKHPNRSISLELKKPIELEKGLNDNIYQLIVLPYRVKNDNYICEKIQDEHLMFLLPKKHRLAKRKSLSMSEINGESILLFQDIGFWKDIVKEKMPNSKFLEQSDRYTFDELIKNSTLPCFTSNLVYDSKESNNDRIALPIIDEEVNITYYLVYKKINKTMIQ